GNDGPPRGVRCLFGETGVLSAKALTILRGWGLVFAFGGIQLAWTLRPFLGDRNQPFQVFGRYQGNFYAAIIYAMNKLLQGDEKPAAPRSRLDAMPRFPIDTVADTTGRRRQP